MSNAPQQSTADRGRLSILAGQAGPAVTSALVLGVGLTAGGDANAALVITDINVTLPTDGTHQFLDIDLNGDANNDFRMQISLFGDSVIQFQALGGGKFKKPAVSIMGFPDIYVSMLGGGDTVDADWFDGTAGLGFSAGNLVDDSGNGPWSAVGAHGFLGLALDLFDGRHYGWLEVTRGSLTVGQMGYQTTAGAGATVVPLPAALPLLASGYAGLMALGLRRRRKAAAQA